jgi:hypothetical protein
MQEARNISQVEVDELFEELDEHTRKGRDILKELRYMGVGTSVGSIH